VTCIIRAAIRNRQAATAMEKNPRGSGQGEVAYMTIGVRRGMSSARDAPGLAKIRRLVGLLQQSAGFPLDVIDDAPAVEASVQADRDKARRDMKRARSAISDSASCCF
jgi:hypothetical protein